MDPIMMLTGLEGLIRSTMDKFSSTGQLLQQIGPMGATPENVGLRGAAEEREATPLRDRSALTASMTEVGASVKALETSRHKKRRILVRAGKVALKVAPHVPVVGQYVKPAVGLATLAVQAKQQGSLKGLGSQVNRFI